MPGRETTLNVERLKNKARKLEEKGNIQKAIDHYIEVLDVLEGTPQLTGELALFNKVGDLYLKISKVQEAVEMYERAVNLYADQGFPNNAIALCNKILRNAPGRTHIYLKLAQLMVERGFVAEAKQNLLEYADRMQKAGKTDEAFRALKEFADLSPDNEEIRLLLAEQLKQAARDDEAREQLAKLYAEARAEGDERRTRSTLDHIKAIDPDFDEESAAATKVKEKKAKSSELVFLDVEYDTDTAPAAEPGPALEPEPAKEKSLEEVLEFDPTALDEELAKDEELKIERVGEEESVTAAAASDVETLEGLDVGPSFEGTDDVEIPSLDIEPTALAESEEPEPVMEELVPAPEVVEPEPVVEEPVVEEPVSGVAPGERDSLEVEAALEAELAALEPVDTSDEDLLAVPDTSVEGDIEVPDLDFGVAMEEEELLGEAAPTTADTELPGLDDIDLDVPTEREEVASAPEPEPGTPEAAAEPVTAEADDGEVAIAELEEAEPEPPAVEEEPAAEILLEPQFDEVVEAPDVGALEAAVADDPDNASYHVALAEALIETGERDRGLEELGISVDLFEADENWHEAAHTVDEIIRIDPENVKYLQKRVEYAYRSGDKAQLVHAYLSLADALFRGGAVERSMAVYKRVLEHDAENERALEALATLETAEPEPAAQEAPAPAGGDGGAAADFVDLGALILEDEPQRDTRMRVQDEEPTGDEERDFAEMLSQFKRGIEENLDDTDWQAHYDLGVAYKEMGLIDEAIAEFQKALRAPEGRLQTAEALGLCFYEKGQYSVAGTVMRRAIEADPSGDEKKIGLLYWMGRCEEEQQRIADALVYYQRVFALDIKFQDVSERVKQLAEAES